MLFKIGQVYINNNRPTDIVIVFNVYFIYMRIECEMGQAKRSKSTQIKVFNLYFMTYNEVGRATKITE